MRAEIQHEEWKLQLAEAEFVTNSVGAEHGLPLTLTPDLLHFSRQLDVLVYPPEAVGER
jgi:hypothetical protein